MSKDVKNLIPLIEFLMELGNVLEKVIKDKNYGAFFNLTDELMSFQSVEWEKVIPSKFLNPNANTVYMMDSMEKLGFHLELAEVPFTEELKVPETRYVTGANELIGNVSPMLHIELVTNDAE